MGRGMVARTVGNFLLPIDNAYFLSAQDGIKVKHCPLSRACCLLLRLTLVDLFCGCGSTFAHRESTAEHVVGDRDEKREGWMEGGEGGEGGE